MSASTPKPDGGKSSPSSGVFAPGGHDSAHLSRHMLALTDLFRTNAQKMPDAMVTEMGRTLGGAAPTMETGMTVGLRRTVAAGPSMLPHPADTPRSGSYVLA